MREVEEDRRLLMQASGCGFRFVVDEERLSNIEGEEDKQTREEGFTWEVGRGDGHRGVSANTIHALRLWR